MRNEMKNLPAFEGHGYFAHQPYEGLCGNVTYGYVGVSQVEADAYLKALLENGFSVYTQNGIHNCVFYTLTKGEMQVRYAYYPNLLKLKLFCSEGQALPAKACFPYEKKVEASITQFGRVGARDKAPGMFYIIQTEDGGYVLIDGGWKNDIDEPAILQYLKDHNPGEGKPVVHYWMITHPHPDHMQLAYHFLEQYAGEIDLRHAAYNMPEMTTLTVPHEDVEHNVAPLLYKFDAAVKNGFPNATTYMFRTGDTLFLPGLRFDFLYTQEDYYPHTFQWGNHLSSAWMITGKEKKVLILGDCEKPLCQQMAIAYESALKCDVLQLTHHGWNGACLELYRHADPDICFWATNEDRFENHPYPLGHEKGFEFNAYLRNPTIKEREHYCSEKTKTVML